MKASEIMGKEVLDKNANKVGRVTEIDLDFTRGVINHLVVKVGLTKRLNITMDAIERAGDKIILKVTRDELEKKPVAQE